MESVTVSIEETSATRSLSRNTMRQHNQVFIRLEEMTEHDEIVPWFPARTGLFRDLNEKHQQQPFAAGTNKDSCAFDLSNRLTQSLSWPYTLEPIACHHRHGLQ